MNYITYNYALDALVAAMDKKIDVQEATKTFTHVLEIKDKMAQTAVFTIKNNYICNWIYYSSNSNTYDR